MLFGWMVGVILGGVIIFLLIKKVQLTWYTWVLGLLGTLFLVASIQHYIGSLEEGYSKAGLLGLLFLGIPALIIFAIAWQLNSRRKVKAT